MLNDFELARKLQEDEFQESERNKEPKSRMLKRSSKENIPHPSSLIDPTWELIDPNPNINSLFIAFDKKYFWSSLGSVEVKWSPRMYSCAGICTYKGRGGCVVSLSLPLLKLRPRKDLIETLLHEMIHAYLFLTKNDRDRDGHGPQFHSHMYRINAEAGTNITVYHSFHDEVRHYKTHWWRCDGPCSLRKPYFGVVKRAMNRPPSKNDFWFAEHQMTCGGNFIKVQEPEGFKSRKKKQDTTNNGAVQPSKNGHPNQKTLNSFFKTSNPSTPPTPVVKRPVPNVQNSSTPLNGTITKINNGNIHGFGSLSGSSSKGNLKSNMGGTLIENPKTVRSDKAVDRSSTTDTKVSAVHPFSGTGYVLAPPGVEIDRSKSKLLSLYAPPPSKKSKTTETSSSPSNNEPLVSCPVCGVKLHSTKINQHLDSCVQIDLTEEIADVKNLPPSPKKSLFASCPVCGKSVYKDKMNEHIDECIQNNAFEDISSDTPSTSGDFNPNPPSPSKALFANCPVCDKKVYKNKMDEHLDSCIRLDTIMDSSGCEIVDLDDDDRDNCDDGRVNCPCCNKVFPSNDINAHLDSCLKYQGFE